MKRAERERKEINSITVNTSIDTVDMISGELGREEKRILQDQRKIKELGKRVDALLNMVD